MRADRNLSVDWRNLSVDWRNVYEAILSYLDDFENVNLKHVRRDDNMLAGELV